MNHPTSFNPVPALCHGTTAVPGLSCAWTIWAIGWLLLLACKPRKARPLHWLCFVTAVQLHLPILVAALYVAGLL